MGLAGIWYNVEGRLLRHGLFRRQPGPLGGQGGAPTQATSQAQPDQAQQPDQGIPSDSEDDDRAREAGPSDVAMPDQAMPDQATHDLAAGGPPANFGHGQFLID